MHFVNLVCHEYVIPLYFDILPRVGDHIYLDASDNHNINSSDDYLIAGEYLVIKVLIYPLSKGKPRDPEAKITIVPTD